MPTRASQGNVPITLVALSREANKCRSQESLLRPDSKPFRLPSTTSRLIFGLAGYLTSLSAWALKKTCSTRTTPVEHPSRVPHLIGCVGLEEDLLHTHRISETSEPGIALVVCVGLEEDLFHTHRVSERSDFHVNDL